VSEGRGGSEGRRARGAQTAAPRWTRQDRAPNRLSQSGWSGEASSTRPRSGPRRQASSKKGVRSGGRHPINLIDKETRRADRSDGYLIGRRTRSPSLGLKPGCLSWSAICHTAPDKLASSSNQVRIKCACSDRYPTSRTTHWAPRSATLSILAPSSRLNGSSGPGRRPPGEPCNESASGLPARGTTGKERAYSTTLPVEGHPWETPYGNLGVP